MFKNFTIQNKISTSPRLLGVVFGFCLVLMICLIARQGYCYYKANKECTEDNRAGNFIELTGTPLFISALTTSLSQDK